MIRGKKETRQQILELAVRHFSSYGYAGTNMEMIGKEAGLSRGPLYYYFRNKKELYLAAVEYDMMISMREYSRIFTQDAPILTKLKEDMSYCLSHVSLFNQTESDMMNESLIKESIEFNQDLYRLKKDALRKAQQNGELKASADLDEMTGFIYIYYYGIKTFLKQNECYHLIDREFPENGIDRFTELFAASFIQE